MIGRVSVKSLFLSLLICLVCIPTSVIAGAGLSLEQTPSWRVIIFLFAFLILSVLVEHSIHKLDHYLVHHGKTGPRAALMKIKDELMLMGFISLVLIMAEDSILAVCTDVSTSGVPVLGTKCIAELHLDELLKPDASSAASSAATSSGAGRRLASKSTLAMMNYCCGLEGSSSASSNSSSSRMLLSNDDTIIDSSIQSWLNAGSIGKGKRRQLAGAADNCQCPCGQTPFIEQAALHQIHVLIFAYASLHIIYGCIVMALAQLKVGKWEEWEKWAENPSEFVFFPFSNIVVKCL
jgi:mlo protein